jgi:predicted Zn-dependent peptidase
LIPQSFKDFDARVSTARLSNGMAFVHVPAAGMDDRFFLSCVIKAGSRSEMDSHSGIAHFLEHMMFRGSKRFPSFGGLAEAFESLGGEWNAATGQEYTEYIYSGVQRHAVEAIDLFLEFLANPLFRDIDVERQIILRELHGETNEFGVSTDVAHHISTLVWPGHALARPIIGTPATLASIDENSLHGFRSRWYQPANMALCVVGGTAAMADMAAKKFATYRPSGEHAPAETDASATVLSTSSLPLSRVIENSDNEYQFQVSFKCEGQWHDEAPVYEVLVRLLSDGFSARLPRRIREQLGLVYDIAADATLLSDCGLLNVTAAVDHENMLRFVSELGAILHQLTHTPPSSSELERYQRRALVDLEMALSEPASMAFRLAWNEINGKRRSIAHYAGRVLAVTPELLRECAATIFHPSNRAAVVLGPKKGTPSQTPGEPALSDVEFSQMIQDMGSQTVMPG